jgi:hypothetical protein
MADNVHEGGCLCGAVRYRVFGAPTRAVACHCRFCQKRTGSAFGESVYFKEEDVRVLSGVMKRYEYRSDESHRWLKMDFCLNCGTTVTWTIEFLPGERAVAQGTLDDPNWVAPQVHGWTRSAQEWMVFPDNVPVVQTTRLK